MDTYTSINFVHKATFLLNPTISCFLTSLILARIILNISRLRYSITPLYIVTLEIVRMFEVDIYFRHESRDNLRNVSLCS
jgi:hypothetical protein